MTDQALGPPANGQQPRPGRHRWRIAVAGLVVLPLPAGVAIVACLGDQPEQPPIGFEGPTGPVFLHIEEGECEVAAELGADLLAGASDDVEAAGAALAYGLSQACLGDIEQAREGIERAEKDRGLLPEEQQAIIDRLDLRDLPDTPDEVRGVIEVRP